MNLTNVRQSYWVVCELVKNSLEKARSMKIL